MNLGVAVIGYSLPDHDEYVQQALYSLIRNFQNVPWDEEYFGQRKVPLVMVDKRHDPASIAEYQRQFGFVNWDETITHYGGFDERCLEDVFAPTKSRGSG